jgi:hypothetical protein
VITLIFIELLRLKKLFHKHRVKINGHQSGFGCTDDFNPNLATESILVIYAIINPDDTIYNVSLTKVFQLKQSSGDTAINPDIEYFNQVKVEFELLNAAGLLLNRAELQPVKMDREIAPAGTFSSLTN